MTHPSTATTSEAKPPGRTDTILLETRGHLRWRLWSSDEFTYDLRQRNRDLMEIAGNVPQHPKGWEDMYVGRGGGLTGELDVFYEVC